jgi:hypothetical protein
MFQRLTRSLLGALPALVCMLALVVGLVSYEMGSAKPVHAATGDSYATFFGNGSTVGVVVTGTTGRKVILKQIIITAQTSVAVVLQENPATGNNATFGQVSLLANVPYEIPASMLQAGTGGVDGYVLASGSGLDIVNQNATSSVISVWVRYALN